MNRGCIKSRLRYGKVLLHAFAECILVSLCFVCLCLPVLSEEPKPDVFRVGFSKRLFSNVSDVDARASIKAWAYTIAKERGLHMDPSAQLYETERELMKAAQEDAVDAISMLLREYQGFSKQIETDHLFITKKSGSFHETYILLVRKDSAFSSVETLKGQTLVFHDSMRTSLAQDWLDFLVLNEGSSSSAGEFFFGIETVPKVTAAVLPVFFSKKNCAVLCASDFSLMCELNPQIERDLEIIAKSPPLIPALMCFRKSFESEEKKELLLALSELHHNPAGEQILNLFKAEELTPVTPDVLEGTTLFLQQTDRMRSEQIKQKGGPVQRESVHE